MLVNELKNKLDEIGVPQDLYSIMTGGGCQMRDYV